MAKRRISARALRFLFASGVLRGKGSGKNRTVAYDKKRAATISRNRKRGVDVTSRKKASQVNKSGRHVFGGSKAARLRSGAGGRSAPSREARIAAGREKALAFVNSERGQRLRSGVEGLRHTSRRTGRRDYDKPRKVKAAKDDLRAAGVKIKTGQALSQHYDLPRLRGDYSRETVPRLAPRYAQQQARAAERTRLLSSVQGKSRAERIAAGRAIANQPLNQGRAEMALTSRYVKKRASGEPITARERAGSRNHRVNQGKLIAYQAKSRLAAAAEQKARSESIHREGIRLRRLKGRENRVARGEAQREAQRQTRLSARTRRAAKAPALERARRIKAGRAVYEAFKKRRDSLYSGSLF